MKALYCDLLDDYLDGELTEPDVQAFERHALDCRSCGVAVAETEALAGLLRCAFHIPTCESPQPIRLPARIWHFRTRWIAACTAGAVAVLLAWVVALFVWEDNPNRLDHRAELAPELPIVSNDANHMNAARTVQSEVKVQLVDAEHMIVRHLRSRNDNVTVVWMYPTFRSAN